MQLVPVVFFRGGGGGGSERSFDVVLLGRNSSQGKLELIYLMLLQAAMIVKSLPKYMYMYSPALSPLTFVYQLKCFGMQSPRTKECMVVSSVTRINNYLNSPVSLIPSGLYTNTSHT